MKRSFLCGLLLVSSIMFGSLFGASSDVNAKKYDIDVLPLWFPNNDTLAPNFTTSHSTFSMIVSDEIDTSQLQELVVLSYQTNSNTQECEYAGFYKQPWFANHSDTTTLDIRYGFSGIDFNIDNNLSDLWDKCISIRSLPNIKLNSVPNVHPNFARDKANTLNPYRISFSGMYRTSSGVLTDTGVTSSTKFNLLSIFNQDVTSNLNGNTPNRIDKVVLPFGYLKDRAELNYGDSILFEGDFILDPENPDLFELDTRTSVRLIFSPAYIQGVNSRVYTSCDTLISSIDVDDSGVPATNLHYSCSMTLPDYNYSQYFPYFQLELNLKYADEGPEYSKLSQFIFDSAVSVTKNDWTPGGSFNDAEVTGKFPDQAPGSIFKNDSIHEDNWLHSLANLFNFNFINPFAGLFGLFSDQSSCASIPTLAGMLNSNETTVCPWFDSNTRNIVTPVLGLASMMLIFGFTVRWLGSRSGNFIEDSGGVDSGGYHFENKFRRKK